MLVFAIFVVFISAGQCAKILGVFMYPAYSHQTVYTRICKELSLRGHQVTMVTPNPFKNPILTNLTEINVDFVYNVLKTNNVQEKYSKDISASESLRNAFRITDEIVNLELDSTQFRNLISDENQNFDLILIHFFHPVMYGLAARYKAPVISVASIEPFASHYSSVGNPNHPYLYPDLYFNFQPGRPTLWDKFVSFYFLLWQTFYYNWVFLPRTHQMAKKYFGDIPYIGELEKNMSMLFAYRSILIEPPKPIVPAVVDISFINTEPNTNLPEDLQKILDEASNGVVYVSFGSSLKTTRFKKTLKNLILETLFELPYKILLKWDSDNFAPNSSQVVARKWYPQRDVLGHPNVKAFVFQGGLQSIEDSILGEVPLIGIPFVTDQSKNIRRLEQLGIGVEVDTNNIDKTELKNLIIKVAENKSFKEKIKHVRKTILDKSLTGLEHAMWWCEYVIRHKGAKHLRNGSIHTSYFHYLLSDVILIPIWISSLTVLILLKIKHR